MASSPEQRQLDTFIDRFSPAVAGTARAVLQKMRTLLPGATQIVYDNYNALAIGFGPSERASEALFSIVLYPKWLTLFFLRGARLPDPGGVLAGSGKQVRSFRLTGGAADLDRQDIQALMAEAMRRDEAPLQDGRSGRLVIRAISAKRRSRTPAVRKAAKSRGANR
jgi:hypothetical protein